MRLGDIPCRYLDSRADCIRRQPDLQPVLSVAAIVSQQARRRISIGDEDINVTIYIIIGERCPAANIGESHRFSKRFSDFGKRAIAPILEEQVALSVCPFLSQFRQIFVQMPVGDKNVAIAIVIVINKRRCPAEIGIGNLGCLSRSRCIREEAVAIVVIECICLFGIVGYGQIQPSIIVPIAERGAHAVFSGTVFAECYAEHEPNFFKRAIAVIAIKEVFGGVVGDVDIGRAIVVVVSPHNAEPFASSVVNASGLRHVCERAIAVIAEERIRLRREVIGLAVSTDAFLFQPTPRVLLKAKDDVVDDVKIEVPIAIVVAKGATGAPPRFGNP